ncbi:MAG: 50S ribosomal protein L10 [Spirochaetales bacterium]|nr:50S ribosomal protein L10 [Spirochaetales bacterium]
MGEKTTKIQQEKIDAIDSLKEQFEQVKDFIFTDYRGMTVEQITSLRNTLRSQDASYRVIKNRFAKLALSQMGMPDVGEQLVGPTAVVLTGSDSGPVAKMLFQATKEMPLSVKGGIISGNVFSAEQVETYSKLPSRDELLSSLMGTMRAPIQNFVYVLNAVPQKLVRTLQAVADQKASA